MPPTDQPPSGCVELGQLIRAARRARGLNQQQLADLASGWAGYFITRDRIAQWERAHRRVSSADLDALELALNIAFAGVSRDVSSAHHAGDWCEVAERAGVAAVICRSTGEHL